MKIRALTIKDMEEVNRLHDKYFGNQFEKTDFMNNFLSAFAITEDDDKLVMAGGVRPIAETILVTDKESNPHLLGNALLEALRFSRYTCNVHKIEFLHAFVKDEAYKRHLLKHGFSERCSALYMDVTNGE